MSPEGPADALALHRLRRGSEIATSIVGSSWVIREERRHCFQPGNFLDPFHTGETGFFDVSALPTVSDHGRDVVGSP